MASQARKAQWEALKRKAPNASGARGQQLDHHIAVFQLDDDGVFRVLDLGHLALLSCLLCQIPKGSGRNCQGSIDWAHKSPETAPNTFANDRKEPEDGLEYP